MERKLSFNENIQNYIDKESFILNYYYHNDISYYNYELRRIKMSKHIVSEEIIQHYIYKY